MTQIIGNMFGDGTKFAIPALGPRSYALAGATTYTDPNYDMFYSEYGFAFPLIEGSPPLQLLLNDQLPFHGHSLQLHHPIRRYLLVDHGGNLWRVLVQPDDNNELIVTYNPVSKRCGWWFASGSSEHSTTHDVTVGFLSMHPTVPMINDFWRKLYAEDLDWFKIIDVVEKLQAKHPKADRMTKFAGLHNNIRAIVNNTVDQAMKNLAKKE